MADAPVLTRGTYTFLFSDIEGSTSLEAAVGRDAYGDLLTRHRTLMRTAWEAFRGDEQLTEGDSFFVVFREAPEAVAAAVAAQRALATETWPDGAPVRVRMGLNTGGADVAGDSYVGVPINRAARIAAVAHGGQILVSGLTRGHLQDAPVDGVSLRDLGDHRLKDLGSPVRIYQVEADGLPTVFPPLLTLDARPNNLPTQLTTFIGRDAELDEVAGLLATTRLLTLTGPGGTGKTRLSLQLAARASDDFPEGVFFVPLEPIRDPILVGPRIASAVGIVESTARSDHRHAGRLAPGQAAAARARQFRAGRRRRRRSWPTSCGPHPTSRWSSPAGRSCTSRASRSTRSRACRRRRT